LKEKNGGEKMFFIVGEKKIMGKMTSIEKIMKERKRERD